MACIGLPALLLTACDLLNRDPPGPSRPPPEKAYRAEILWEREINTSSSIARPLIEGQYCYYPARENYPGGDRNIVKINLEENGRVEWESRGANNSTEYPQKIGPYIYLLTFSGFIYVYNDSDGKLAATIKLETVMQNNDMYYFTSAAVSGPYLFWGREDGLMRFDSRLIDFSKAPGATQNIAPEQIWSNPPQTRIFADFILEDGTLYFITRYYIYYTSNPDFAPEIPATLIALDAETGDVIWEREAPHCKGVEDNVLVLNGDKLLVVEATFSSYDKLTGVPILENIPLGYERRYYRHDRITLYNNRLFYIGDWNLVSVDADIGKPIWSVSQADIVSGNDEFSSSPLVNNRQVFILHETGLRVYDAVTGEFIGVDGSFRGKDGVQSSYEVAVYKDAYIFYNYRLNYVTAIRCKDREEP